jgi:5-oxoprolinase (ATP-hydrolysing)
MEGGGDAASGRNTWVKQPREEDGDLPENDGSSEPRYINIGGKATVWMGKVRQGYSWII